ncbi:hypothetical protein DSM19430T_07720 [Desulfovibrio psychrotolerans]|uniref:Uncharacterized protein n=1 Tax=Desulfovibrio psychrotolerans TaxID=415242 RepID=A0A7J0BR05_9BACT|nr:hypothetical protein DSM19430T_07720 [Desulfovibrio psychrotolerans]
MQTPQSLLPPARKRQPEEQAQMANPALLQQHSIREPYCQRAGTLPANMHKVPRRKAAQPHRTSLRGYTGLPGLSDLSGLSGSIVLSGLSGPGSTVPGLAQKPVAPCATVQTASQSFPHKN